MMNLRFLPTERFLQSLVPSVGGGSMEEALGGMVLVVLGVVGSSGKGDTSISSWKQPS